MKFYKDKGEKFICELDIEGASIDDSQVRLILEFTNDKTFLFIGKLTKDGMCEVNIPPLKDVNSSKGKAILEVIAESTYFTPWESNFEVETSKKVSIKEVVLLNSGDQKQSNMSIKVKQPELIKEQIKESKVNELKINVKKEASQSSKTLIKTILQKVAKLNTNQRKELMESAAKYNPSNGTKTWANKTFEDVDNVYSKLCMYLLENKN